MKRLVVAVVIAAGCGNSYEPRPESEVEMDEALVTTFEEMAKLAAEDPPCTRWADENKRRWGVKRLKAMNKRMLGFDRAKADAFRAKYGKRIDAARDAVIEISERCLRELQH